MEVAGDLTLGRSANFILPFQGGYLRLGGDLDCAIDASGRFDLSRGELMLDGHGDEQRVEVMSSDIGPSEEAFDRSQPGRFPLGGMRVVSGSRVSLVDRRDNDAAAGSEALYVDHLVVEADARLATNGLTVYYRSLDLEGQVDGLEHLVQIAGPCVGDFNRDGGVDGEDVTAFFSSWEGGMADADVNTDGAVDGQDVQEFFARWEAGC
jgi:hypothetical protein